jgi:threonine dehydrogenase-like Zn-dependent dehydrogenase
MMTDALATAWFGARNADIRPGSSVAVIGLGPIGLMAVDSAFVMGAGVVYAIDPVPERRAMAEASGAIALAPEIALETIREATHGRKLDCIIEAVGHDSTVDLALRLVTRRGTVSVIGVQQSRRFAFPLERAFAAGLTFRIGTCSVPEEWPALIPLVQSGRLRPERYISHTLPLSAGSDAYATFERREAGALKMVLTP